MILQKRRTCNGQKIDDGFGDVISSKWWDQLSNIYIIGARALAQPVRGRSRFEVGLRQRVTAVCISFSTHDAKTVYNASVILWCGYHRPH